jgi:hypothetical protein
LSRDFMDDVPYWGREDEILMVGILREWVAESLAMNYTPIC